MSPSRQSGAPGTPAFTIIELLVSISIIALLIGILLPAISKARDSARLTQSLTNLRNLAAAHQAYAAEWNDRQFTLVRDDLAQYGSLEIYTAQLGVHPEIRLGLGWLEDVYQVIGYEFEGMGMTVNKDLVWPIQPQARFGWYRLPNAAAFSAYVNGRFYDPVFYAPKDSAVLEAVGDLFEQPGDFSHELDPIIDPFWSSYSISPAGLFAPGVLKAQDPTLNALMSQLPAAAFRCPSMSQARHPSLKTHMLEQHWLQGRSPNQCNPAFENPTYDGCEPYYFNHAMASAPCTMFFDGSVRVLGVREAVSGDEQVREPGGHGLYFRPGDEGFDEAAELSSDGFFLNQSYDLEAGEQHKVGFHILTKDGILGRDSLGGQ